jgi:hypothetical protein
MRLIGTEFDRKRRVRTIDELARYLLGMPLVGDFLEESLSLPGYSCEEFEFNRL